MAKTAHKQVTYDRGRVTGRDTSYTWYVCDVTANRKPIAQSGNAPRDSFEAHREGVARAIEYLDGKDRGYCLLLRRSKRRWSRIPIVLVTVRDREGQIIHSEMIFPRNRAPRRGRKGG